jgi:hypothetical protein
MSKKSFKGGIDSLLGGGLSREERQQQELRRTAEAIQSTTKPTSIAPAQQQEETPAAAEAVADTLIPLADKKRGRPRTNYREIEKSSQEGCRESETRATFIVNEADLERIKAVAYWERIQIKDAINAALREYIERYEAKNGPLQPKPEKR